ncbi:MAG: hypothetical protein JO347_04180 [Candidatus Eremiobacteraeota bacterium]|nr:hypothetical protein [Candidatus Eremiobacteraeota bacterium]
MPGINETEGNPLAASSLKSITTLTTNKNAGVYYDPTTNRVVVHQADALLQGFNFGSAGIDIGANGVTIKDCTFSEPDNSIGASVYQTSTFTGLVVQNCTFAGGAGDPNSTVITSDAGTATIENNSFTDISGHGICIENGTISDNYIAGGGYGAGVHADAIQIEDTFGPITISGNLIDWTNNPDADEGTNNTIRISTDCGNTSNVWVTGNFLLGGAYSVIANPTTVRWVPAGGTGTVGQLGTMTNVDITGNYFGFAEFGEFYPGSPAVTTGNTLIDYTNPAYATAAWNAYSAKGVGTQYRVVSSGANISGNPNGTTTLYGNGYYVYLVASGLHETVFVGGPGKQYMDGGAGANIFKFLSVGDSAGNGSHDVINNFDPGKDVIDLSAINSNPGGISGASSNFTFIGTSAFTSAGDQVRYQYDPTTNQTIVEANLAGDTSWGSSSSANYQSPDIVIDLTGDLTLTAANFALTSAESAADMTAGGALLDPYVKSGSAFEYNFSNVQGRAYTSYSSVEYSGQVAADNYNVSASTNQISLSQNGVTLTRGAGSETFAIGSGSFAFTFHSNETINAADSGADTFAFGSGFGNETINGFGASGANADTLQLSVAAFSYLNAGMTQAQDLAAVLSQATSSPGTGRSPGALTITDSAGDSLSLAGITSATLAANPTAVKFV